MQDLTPFVRAALVEARAALDRAIENGELLARVAQAADAISESLANGGKVYSCGNGGSMCDAMHFAEELSGKFRKPRAPLAAMAISDPAHLSCSANDYGYDAVFSRFIEAHGRPGDVLLAISTSGKSPNVLKACVAARQKSMRIIGLTGKAASPLQSWLDIEICTPGGAYSDRIQELHIKVIHILIELTERRLFPENCAD